MIPEAGGSYRWVRRAHGRVLELPERLVVDAFGVHRLRRLRGPRARLHPEPARPHRTGSAGSSASAIVAVFTFINIRGLELTGWSLTVIQIVVMVPLLIFTVSASSRARATRSRPFMRAGPEHAHVAEPGPGDHDVDVLRLGVDEHARRRDREPAEGHPEGADDRHAHRDLHLLRDRLGRHPHRRVDGPDNWSNMVSTERRRHGLHRGGQDRRRRLPRLAHARVGHRSPTSACTPATSPRAPGPRSRCRATACFPLLRHDSKRAGARRGSPS